MMLLQTLKGCRPRDNISWSLAARVEVTGSASLMMRSKYVLSSPSSTFLSHKKISGVVSCKYWIVFPSSTSGILGNTNLMFWSSIRNETDEVPRRLVVHCAIFCICSKYIPRAIPDGVVSLPDSLLESQINRMMRALTSLSPTSGDKSWGRSGSERNVGIQ